MPFPKEKSLTSTINPRLQAPRKGSFFDRLNRRMQLENPSQPRLQVKLGDNRTILATYPDNHFDSIVTDPPAGISFMDQEWDGDHGGRDAWIAKMELLARDCFRVLKPGAHALVWALPRTSHWTTTAWENAGFEVRDVVHHLFGSGFPKSHNISKAIDREAENHTGEVHVTAPATDAARQYEGWGTALKPAVENWILLRKPLERGLSIAANVQKWGTGALNIDGSRVPVAGNDVLHDGSTGRNGGPMAAYGAEWTFRMRDREAGEGRWPANLVHDGSAEVLSQFPNTKSTSGTKNNRTCSAWMTDFAPVDGECGFNDDGSAARFFYCTDPSPKPLLYIAKAPRSERDVGVEEHVTIVDGKEKTGNVHATVKSVALMTYLIKLITPPDGLVLDPFAGSGTTLMACHDLGMRGVGIEIDAKYHDISTKRLSAWIERPTEKTKRVKKAA